MTSPVPCSVLGRPDDRVQVIDARDLAEWIVRSVESGQTGVFDGVGPVQPVGEIIAATAEGVGTSPDIVWTSQEFLTEQEVEPWSGDGALPLWLPRPEYEGMMTHAHEASRRAGLVVRPSPRPPATPWPGCGRRPRPHVRACRVSARPRYWRRGRRASRTAARPLGPP